MDDQDEIGESAITEEAVATLARIAGLRIPAGDLSAVAARLAELYVLAADLDGIDLEGVEPSVRYDPRWPEEATA